MIGIKGQFTVTFSIGGITDFLEGDDLARCVIIEEANHLLPEFELSFTSDNLDVVEKCNEGNVVEIKHGLKPGEGKKSKFRIKKATYTRSGENLVFIYMHGIYDAPNYGRKSTCKIYDKKPATDIMTEVGNRHFSVDCQAKSFDNMHWIQDGRTDKDFMLELMQHAYIPGSCVGIGIDCEGKMLIRDMQSLNDGNLSLGANGIPIQGNLEAIENQGFLNHWIGYEDRRQIYKDLEKGAEVEEITEKVETLILKNGKLNRLKGVEKRLREHKILNENMHENFWKAQLRNIAQLAVLSSVGFTVHLAEEKYTNVNIFDAVTVEEDTPNKVGQINPYISGKYVVGKVARFVEKNRFRTSLSIHREAYSRLSGELG